MTEHFFCNNRSANFRGVFVVRDVRKLLFVVAILFPPRRVASQFTSVQLPFAQSRQPPGGATQTKAASSWSRCRWTRWRWPPRIPLRSLAPSSSPHPHTHPPARVLHCYNPHKHWLISTSRVLQKCYTSATNRWGQARGARPSRSPSSASRRGLPRAGLSAWNQVAAMQIFRRSPLL